MDELELLKEEVRQLTEENHRLAERNKKYEETHKRLQKIIEQQEKAKQGLNRREDITDDKIIELYNSGLKTAYKIVKALRNCDPPIKCCEPTIRKKLKELKLFRKQENGGINHE